jgi:NAD(P)H-flavin reductase
METRARCCRRKRRWHTALFCGPAGPGQPGRELVDLRPGEEAELIGPLGNYWALADIFAPDSSEPCYEDATEPIALVGGGIGIAPLLAFAEELGGRLRNPVLFDFYAGFRSGSFGLENIKSQASSMRSLIIATEDGSEGVKGRITEFFPPAGYSGVFACGPEPMLKVVGDACIASEIPCFISLERHMACGVGACLGCTVKTTAGNRHCCVDGPIFNAEEICFDR